MGNGLLPRSWCISSCNHSKRLPMFSKSSWANPLLFLRNFYRLGQCLPNHSTCCFQSKTRIYQALAQYYTVFLQPNITFFSINFPYPLLLIIDYSASTNLIDPILLGVNSFLLIYFGNEIHFLSLGCLAIKLHIFCSDDNSVKVNNGLVFLFNSSLFYLIFWMLGE